MRMGNARRCRESVQQRDAKECWQEVLKYSFMTHLRASLASAPSVALISEVGNVVLAVSAVVACTRVPTPTVIDLMRAYH